MERFRLKNIIILILALLNVCLLASLVWRNAAEQESRRHAAEQLVELFAASHVTLDADVISYQTPPIGRTLTRDAGQDHALAAAFLGDDLTATDQGGGIYIYGNEYGAARCNSNGVFDIVGTQVHEDAESFCRKFCQQNDYQNLILTLDADGSGIATAVRYYEKYPVFNCTITFTIESGALTRVNGTRLPSTAVEYSDETPLSATAALTAFLDMHRENGSVASAVTDMYLCFELQNTAASQMTLIPCWCIVTDAVSYYVNCYTAAVTRG